MEWQKGKKRRFLKKAFRVEMTVYFRKITEKRQKTAQTGRLYRFIRPRPRDDQTLTKRRPRDPLKSHPERGCREYAKMTGS
jgi:hypothetical protein